MNRGATDRQRALRIRRHARVRRKVAGTAERPRLAVHRSNRHISAQLIDDVGGRTLAAASSVEPELRERLGSGGGGNVAGAEAVGRLLASRAKAAGITAVVFDRGGFAYHGRVAKLADTARSEGLEF
ncbi:MAG: 50S ribosomal protein L18 [Acidimicrobiales bacterium]